MLFPARIRSAIQGDIKPRSDMGKVLLLDAVRHLLSHSSFVALTIGTITLGARCNELILLDGSLRDSCG